MRDVYAFRGEKGLRIKHFLIWRNKILINGVFGLERFHFNQNGTFCKNSLTFHDVNQKFIQKLKQTIIKAHPAQKIYICELFMFINTFIFSIDWQKTSKQIRTIYLKWKERKTVKHLKLLIEKSAVEIRQFLQVNETAINCVCCLRKTQKKILKVLFVHSGI